MSRRYGDAFDELYDDFDDLSERYDELSASHEELHTRLDQLAHQAETAELAAEVRHHRMMEMQAFRLWSLSADGQAFAAWREPARRLQQAVTARDRAWRSALEELRAAHAAQIPPEESRLHHATPFAQPVASWTKPVGIGCLVLGALGLLPAALTAFSVGWSAARAGNSATGAATMPLYIVSALPVVLLVVGILLLVTRSRQRAARAVEYDRESERLRDAQQTAHARRRSHFGYDPLISLPPVDWMDGQAARTQWERFDRLCDDEVFATDTPSSALPPLRMPRVRQTPTGHQPLDDLLRRFQS